MTQLSVLAKPARTSYSGDDRSISAYWFECSIGVVGVFLFMASIASLPVTGGLALGVGSDRHPGPYRCLLWRSICLCLTPQLSDNG